MGVKSSLFSWNKKNIININRFFGNIFYCCFTAWNLPSFLILGLRRLSMTNFFATKKWKMKNYFNKNIEILLNDECLNNNNDMQQQTKSDNKIDEDESINYDKTYYWRINNKYQRIYHEIITIKVWVATIMLLTTRQMTMHRLQPRRVVIKKKLVLLNWYLRLEKNLSWKRLK